VAAVYGTAAPPHAQEHASGRPGWPHGGPGGPGGPPEHAGFGDLGAPPRGPQDWQRPDESRLEARAEPDAPADPPPQVRNGRVLLAVVAAAVLLLALPFGIIWGVAAMRGASGGDFEVGSCVKRSGAQAEVTDCGDSGAFEVVSKVGNESQCQDKNQPHAVLPDSAGNERVLCLRPAKK
jgi:hypothetical protein